MGKKLSADAGLRMTLQKMALTKMQVIAKKIEFGRIDPKIHGHGGPSVLRTAELQRSSSQKHRRPRRLLSDIQTEKEKIQFIFNTH